VNLLELGNKARIVSRSTGCTCGRRSQHPDRPVSFDSVRDQGSLRIPPMLRFSFAPQTLVNREWRTGVNGTAPMVLVAANVCDERPNSLVRSNLRTISQRPPTIVRVSEATRDSRWRWRYHRRRLRSSACLSQGRWKDRCQTELRMLASKLTANFIKVSDALVDVLWRRDRGRPAGCTSRVDIAIRVCGWR
jgi:hypothetical protein